MGPACKFRKTYLEITTACNLACDFCPGTTRPVAYLDVNRADRYLSLLAPISGTLHLHVMGEPLLHPDFAAILDRCAAHGAMVNLVTNGTLLSRHATILHNSLALQQISISLHSLEANAEQNVAAYIAEVIAFLSTPSPHPMISLRLWNRKQSLDSAATQSFLSALCASGIYAGKPDTLLNLLQTKGALPLSERLFINTADRFEWPSLATPDQGETGRCPGLRDQIAVLVDGTVVPCCLDGNGVTALGNLETQSLPEILASPRSNAMRNGFLKGHITEPLCRHCAYRQRFDKNVLQNPTDQ